MALHLVVNPITLIFFNSFGALGSRESDLAMTMLDLESL
jgi:hypothetical protein